VFLLPLALLKMRTLLELLGLLVQLATRLPLAGTESSKLQATQWQYRRWRQQQGPP